MKWDKSTRIALWILALLAPIALWATDDPTGKHVQGCQEIGQSATLQRPVLSAWQDSNGNVVVPQLTAAGAVPVSGTISSGTVTANQGTPNAAGASSWPTQGAQAAGAAITANPNLVAGQNGGNVKILSLDANGGVNQGNPNAAGTASWGVQGAAAAGTALTGNPLLLGVSDGTNIQILRAANSGSSPGNTGILISALALWDTGGSAQRPMESLASSTDANAGVFWPAAGQLLFNGTNWDRERNNTDSTILASGSRTTTQTVSVTTYNARGVMIYVNDTVPGTGSITPSIQYVDPVSGAAFTILTGTAITTATTQRLEVYPGITATANVSASDHVPRVINVVITANNANPVTYSVGSTLLY